MTGGAKKKTPFIQEGVKVVDAADLAQDEGDMVKALDFIR